METPQAVEMFTQYLHRRYGDRSTPKHYLSDLRIFLSQLGSKPLREVTARDIDHFIDRQHGQRLAPTTINRRLATLHTFFEWLAAQAPDEPRSNPVHWRHHRIREGQPLPRDASDLDVDRLFRIIEDGRDAAMFGLMVGAGLRVEEVAHLKLADLTAPDRPDQMAPLRVRGKGGKERLVWLTPSWHAKVADWLQERPSTESEHLFLNQHGRGLSKDGIQYRLKRYCHAAGITLTCHQLRHTFARRLAEQRMPIESLSKLLGHVFVTTTQRYTSGADPDLRDLFQEAMSRLEEMGQLAEPRQEPIPEMRWPSRQPEQADPAKLTVGLSRFDAFPAWLRDELRAYTQYRWRGWKPHLAARYVTRLTCQLKNAWLWLLDHRAIDGWAALLRSDLESWLDERRQGGLSTQSQYTELCDLRAFLQFVIDRGQLVNPNVLRIVTPSTPNPLPKHLTDAEYERLLKTVLAETAELTPVLAAARAWFLTLAHTGMRVNELLDLRLGDIDLASERIFIRNGKNGGDRISFITPMLASALQSYLTQRTTTENDHLWFHEGRLPSDGAVRNQLRKWGAICNVSVTPHRLRHTFATRLINHGMSLESVRKLLGHRSLQMTQHYARLYDSTVKAQFRSATAALEGISVSDWPMPTSIPTVAQDMSQLVDSV